MTRSRQSLHWSNKQHFAFYFAGHGRSYQCCSMVICFLWHWSAKVNGKNECFFSRGWLWKNRELTSNLCLRQLSLCHKGVCKVSSFLLCLHSTNDMDVLPLVSKKHIQDKHHCWISIELIAVTVCVLEVKLILSLGILDEVR